MDLNNLISKLSRFSLFIYIIIFTVGTWTTLNRMGLALVVAICGLDFLITKRHNIKRNYFFIGLVLYGILLYISGYYSIAPAVRIEMTLRGYLTMLIVVFFVIENINDEKDIDFFLNAFVIAGVVQCIYMLSAYGADIFDVIAESDTSIRVGGKTGNANSVGMSFVYSAVIALSFFVRQDVKLTKKPFYLAVVIMGAVFGLFSGSRKSLAMLFIGVFVIMYFNSINKKNFIKGVFIFLVTALLLIILYNAVKNNPIFRVTNERMTALIEGIQGKGKLDSSAKTRFRMIEIGLDAFKEHPLIGQGIYASYAYFRTYSHNNFVEVLMNTGIIGFIVFYWSYLLSIINMFKTRKNGKFYGLMLFLLIWILFGGYGMVTYYNKYENTLLAILVSWIYINRREEYNEKKAAQCIEKS